MPEVSGNGNWRCLNFGSRARQNVSGRELLAILRALVLMFHSMISEGELPVLGRGGVSAASI